MRKFILRSIHVWTLCTCIALFLSCNKIAQPENQESQISSPSPSLQTMSTSRVPPVSNCGSEVSREVSRYRNNIDTSDFRKNNGVVYWIPFNASRGGIKIYNIPFANNTAATPHFMLIATDENETVFKGNEITIIYNPDFQTTGVFSGQIRCKPITNSLTELYAFSGSKRTTFLANGKAVVPVQPMPVVITLPEVIVVGHYPASGGFDWGLWLNLLDLVGVIPGIGPIGGGLSGGGGGGGYGSGYYGPVITPGMPQPYPPGSEVIVPPGGSCPMPVVPPSYTSEAGNDFSHPNGQVDVPEQSLVQETHVEISDIPANTPPGTPRVIAKTAYRGNTEDMEHGTTGDPTGFPYPLPTLSDNNLFGQMNDLIQFFTIFNGAMTNVGYAMVQRFRDNTGAQFEHPDLTANVEVSETFNDFLKLFARDLNTKLQAVGYNFNNVTQLELGYRPVFNSVYHRFHGLQITMNDTESTEIKLDNSQSWPDGTWTADVTVTILDHYGLDRHDALTYQNYHSGFAAWYILQHMRNYRPFETKVTIKKRIAWHPQP